MPDTSKPHWSDTYRYTGYQVRSIECQDCRWHSTLHIRDYCEHAQSYIAEPRCAGWCVHFEARPEIEDAE